MLHDRGELSSIRLVVVVVIVVLVMVGFVDLRNGFSLRLRFLTAQKRRELVKILTVSTQGKLFKLEDDEVSYDIVGGGSVWHSWD